MGVHYPANSVPFKLLSCKFFNDIHLKAVKLRKDTMTESLLATISCEGEKEFRHHAKDLQNIRDKEQEILQLNSPWNKVFKEDPEEVKTKKQKIANVFTEEAFTSIEKLLGHVQTRLEK